jgi:hypothetical protein
MKIEYTLPQEPSEVDLPKTLMPKLREMRDQALKHGDMKSAIFLTHVHAWLYWSNEILEREK